MIHDHSSLGALILTLLGVFSLRAVPSHLAEERKKEFARIRAASRTSESSTTAARSDWYHTRVPFGFAVFFFVSAILVLAWAHR